MKKLFAILAATVAVALCLVSCNKNGGIVDPTKGGLSGTTWVATYSGTEDGITAEENLTLTFKNATAFNMRFVIKVNGKTTFDENVDGTYTATSTSVTLTAKDEEGNTDSITGTISGNTIKFKTEELGTGEGEYLVLTKQ